MNDLLATTIKAHGGQDRWNQLNTVSARLTQGGALWALKGQEGVLDSVVVTANLHDERVSHRPFGAPDRRSAFTPGRVAIETEDGTVLESLDQPRASFAGHTAETPWNALQLAYFAGAAMWTYLTQPFSFTLPGFRMTELDPWEEAGQLWRRLLVAWPSHLATHSTEQTLYLSPDGLLVRHDYDVEISSAQLQRTTSPITSTSKASWCLPRTGSCRVLPTASRSPSPSSSRSASARSRSPDQNGEPQ
jgi:hypothetical protein